MPGRLMNCCRYALILGAFTGCAVKAKTQETGRVPIILPARDDMTLKNSRAQPPGSFPLELAKPILALQQAGYYQVEVTPPNGREPVVAPLRDDPRWCQDKGNRTLEIVNQTRVNVRELSGLARTRMKGRDTLVAVGDHDRTIALLPVRDNFAAGDAAICLGSEPDPSVMTQHSEWEAGACDGRGRSFIGREDPPVVIVIEPRGRGRIATIGLKVEGTGDLAALWHTNASARVEGLILLVNGHLLVTKQSHPPALMEFAPAGAAAEGIRPDLWLGPEQEFPLPGKGDPDFFLVKHWVLAEAGELDDLSELATDRNGQLYLLSGKSQRIARVTLPLDTEDGAFHLARIWDLPGSLAKPEGLVIGADGGPLVGLDIKGPHANLYRLSPLYR